MKSYLFSQKTFRETIVAKNVAAYCYPATQNIIKANRTSNFLFCHKVLHESYKKFEIRKLPVCSEMKSCFFSSMRAAH